MNAEWPEGVIARYLTVGGNTVDLTETDRDEHGGGVYVTYANCNGCPATWSAHWENGHELAIAQVRDWAQSHAETCRAMPRPGGA